MIDRSRDDQQHLRQLRYFSTLKVIAETLNNGVNLHSMLDSTLSLAVALLQLHTGWMFLQGEQGEFVRVTAHELPPALADCSAAWDGTCECQRIARRGKLHAAQIVECSRLRDATGDRHGLAYHASVPLVKGERLLGIMNVATSEWDMFTPQDIEILAAIGHQVATAIERTQLAEQATRMALLEERNRLAREVHDTLAQDLTGIALQLEAADALLDSAPERARARIRQALACTRESLQEARRSVLDLRAGPLERQALPAALEGLGQRFRDETGLVLTTDIARIGLRLPARIEEALYRIAQEALVNVRRHAQASTVQLVLRLESDHVQLQITDNGQGFAVSQMRRSSDEHEPHSFGLIGMQERAHLLNGSMQICSSVGAGTQITVRLPLAE